MTRPAMLDREQLAAEIGVDPRQISHWRRSGRFPSPHDVGERRFRWPSREFFGWVAFLVSQELDCQVTNPNRNPQSRPGGAAVNPTGRHPHAERIGA